MDPVESYSDMSVVTHGQILSDYTLGYAWIEANLIKTGFNTRKTTKKGVRRMRVSLSKEGFMPSNAVVVIPADITRFGSDMFMMDQKDLEEGVKFQCVDGMHRTRCVQELAAEKAEGLPGSESIFCGDEVYAIILRPDTPRNYLIQLSLSKST